jgi:hypothetical protein
LNKAVDEYLDEIDRDYRNRCRNAHNYLVEFNSDDDDEEENDDDDDEEENDDENEPSSGEDEEHSLPHWRMGRIPGGRLYQFV